MINYNQFLNVIMYIYLYKLIVNKINNMYIIYYIYKIGRDEKSILFDTKYNETA